MSKWSDTADLARRLFIGAGHPRCDGPLDGIAVTSRADTATLRTRTTCVTCGERETVPGNCALRCRECLDARLPDGWSA